VLCGIGRDQVIGALLIVLSVAVIIVYRWVVFFTEWSLLLIQVTGFVTVAEIFGILAWIGYTLATTPPKPIEEIEKELEEELKNLESKSAEEAKEASS